MRRKEGAFVAAQAVVVAAVLILVSLPLEPSNPQPQATGSSSVVSSAIQQETIPLSFLSCNSSSSTSVMSSTTAVNNPEVVAAVRSSFDNHMQLVASRDVSALVVEYERNASVTWTGESAGFGGSYNGTTSIKYEFKTTLGDWFAPAFSVSNETESVIATGGASAYVSSAFLFSGRSNVMGNFSGTVLAQDSYSYSSAGGWLISRETWNFTRFNIQYSVISGGPGPGPSPILNVGAANFSPDGNYLAAGSADYAQKNGSVYLVSLQRGAERELWDDNTNNSAISSVAVSDNGSYVAAGGYWSGMIYGGGVVYLFNNDGRLLWNYSTGDQPVWEVGIAPNGSGVLADYSRGLIYFDDAGHVLWNYTFPYGGDSTHFSMSSNGEYIAAAVSDMLPPNQTNLSWGVVYLDSQGHLLWNYSGDESSVNYIQMSGDGSAVAAGTLASGYSGSVYYFDGHNGNLLWKRQAYTAVQPLVMSSDGAYIASGGNVGTLLLNSKGGLLWNYTTAGEPVGFTQGGSLVILSGSSCPDLALVGYNGATAETLEVDRLTAVASSPSDSEWAAFAGSIAGDGQCGSAYLFNGTSAILSIPLC